MQSLALIGLLQMNLPGEDVLLCDGGFIVWGAATYRSSHPVFGTLSSVSPLSEGVGVEIPALDLTFAVPGAISGAAVAQPGFQKSRVRLWLGEYVPATGLISGTPTLLFDGQVDQVAWNQRHELSVTVVSQAERLLLRNTGNSLNPTFHKSVWPGELGHDNAIGLSIPIAWGVEAPVAPGGNWNATAESVNAQVQGYLARRMA